MRSHLRTIERECGIDHTKIACEQEKLGDELEERLGDRLGHEINREKLRYWEDEINRGKPRFEGDRMDHKRIKHGQEELDGEICHMKLRCEGDGMGDRLEGTIVGTSTAASKN